MEADAGVAAGAEAAAVLVDREAVGAAISAAEAAAVAALGGVGAVLVVAEVDEAAECPPSRMSKPDKNTSYNDLPRASRDKRRGNRGRARAFRATRDMLNLRFRKLLQMRSPPKAGSACPDCTIDCRHIWRMPSWSPRKKGCLPCGCTFRSR